MFTMCVDCLIAVMQNPHLVAVSTKLESFLFRMHEQRCDLSSVPACNDNSEP